MKKLIASLAILLAFGTTALAAPLPKEGTYLNKDGSLVTAEQEQPPQLIKAKMLPEDANVHEALKMLPHSAATVLKLTINEDGAVTHTELLESSTSLILDQYAASSVEGWSFKPAMRGEKAVVSNAAVPIRFVSSMVAVPAAPVSPVMKDMNDEVRDAAERNNHPVIQVKVFITNEGKMDGKPESVKPEAGTMSSADFKILGKYAEDCVKKWTFTPAQNPDGESIGADTLLDVTL